MVIQRVGNRIRRYIDSRVTRHRWRLVRRQLVQVEGDIEQLESIAKSEFGLWQKSSEIRGLLELFQSEKPVCVGEIGVLQGGNSFLFMQFLAGMSDFVGVDLRLQNAKKLLFLAPESVTASLIQGDSTSDTTLGQVAAALDGRQFDCLFIDGDHSYEGVRRDFEAYRPLVRSGGLIAFHDVVPDEVARGLKSRQESDWNAGEVYRFWCDIKDRFESYEFIDDKDQIGFGIGVIRLP